MKIHELVKSKGIKNKQKRRGRWNGTGTGNYSGKGCKGQKSRSGYSMKPFFEGWQTSIVQRVPKARGFTRYYKLVKNVAIINIGVFDADERISDTMEITKELLKELWYIKSVTNLVKILWQGDYSKHLTFKDIDMFSASAKAKMEKPGTARSVAKKTPVKVVKDPKSKVWKLKIKNIADKKVAPKKTVKVAAKAEKLIETKAEVKKETPVKKPSKEDKAPVKKAVVKKETPTKKLSKEDKAPAKKTK